jgi:hypothetical protein
MKWRRNKQVRASAAPSGGVTRVQIDIAVTELRQRLGLTREELPDAPTEAQVQAALSGGPVRGGFSVPEGMVLVDEETWNSVQAESVDLEGRVLAHERDTLVDEAIRLGKIAPSRREAYQQMYDTDPEGAREAIAALAEGMVPVQARGRAGSPLSMTDPETLIQAAIAEGKFSAERAEHYRGLFRSDPAAARHALAALQPARRPGVRAAATAEPDDAYPPGWLPDFDPVRASQSPGPVTLEDPAMVGANAADLEEDWARQRRVDSQISRYGFVGRGG